jgi:hypothetical protein
MLHEFLTANRQELIKRCLGKASKRDSPRTTSSSGPDHGVPLFLGQLVEALRYEQANPASQGKGNSGSSPAATAESSRTAALHGKQLLDDGYSVDQVVHGYGDVCQSITELAGEISAPVTVEEFHTLNRMLDNAIADAVSSFGQHRDSVSSQGAQDMHEQMGTLAQEQRVLLDTALKALDAIKVGNIGLMGATGTLLEDSLMKLRALIDKSLPEIHLSSGMTTSPDRRVNPTGMRTLYLRRALDRN